MKRPAYPIEELRLFLKTDCIEKLLYLMKRNKLKSIYFSNKAPTPGAGGFMIPASNQHKTLTAEGRIETQDIVWHPNAEPVIDILDSMSFSDFVDKLEESTLLLQLSKEMKLQIEHMLNHEKEILDSIQEIKSLKIGGSPAGGLLIERI